jgi:hypothetical protein
VIPLHEFMRAAAREDYRRSCIKLMAFLGRYGHQSLDVMMRTPVTILQDLSEEVGALLEEEGSQLQNTVATGGGG